MFFCSFDFYLVSQCVRQGTVGPTSYNIIENTLGINANKIQRFTYKMCHMYFNWSGTVAVPAPCQYAHKLAFLTAQSLHRYSSLFIFINVYLHANTFCFQTGQFKFVQELVLFVNFVQSIRLGQGQSSTQVRK